MRIVPPTVEPPTRPLSIPEVARVASSNLLNIIPELAYVQPMLSGRTVARWHMLMDPEGLRQVLKDKVEQYPKSDTTLRILRPAIGESLFTAEGAHWRWQRRAAAPVFQHRNLLTLAPFMQAAAARTVRRVEAHAGSIHDLYTEMVTATFDVICDVAMSGREAFDRGAVGRSVTQYIQTIGRVSLFDVLALPDWIPRPATILNRGGTDEVRQMMDRIITERATDKPRNDLMSMMLGAEDPETGRRMTQEELRDNMLAFLVAGHETTALALAWALYLIALDNDVQERLYDEVNRVTDGGAPGADDLGELCFTRQVIEEAMRLYPPAGMISRTARDDDLLCRREVRKGDTVIVPIYALHRHRMWWRDPDAFDPENFSIDSVQSRNRFIYLPFGAGPRICIGMNFSIIEAQLILAALVAKFRFRTVAGATPKPQMIMTLRPKGGVKLAIELRA